MSETCGIEELVLNALCQVIPDAYVPRLEITNAIKFSRECGDAFHLSFSGG